MPDPIRVQSPDVSGVWGFSLLPWSLASPLFGVPLWRHASLAWALGQDPRSLCKRLELKGWERWPAAVDPDAPQSVVVPRIGAWAVALWAMAYYRGPVTWVDTDQRERSIHLGRGELGMNGQRLRHRVYLVDGATITQQPELRVVGRRLGRKFAVEVERGPAQ